MTLVAKTTDGKPPSAESLEQAREIIQKRVDAFGVSEAEVVTEGNNHIVISVPGENNDAIRQVGVPAQLRFRKVINTAQDLPAPATTPSATPSAGASGTATPNATTPTHRPHHAARDHAERDRRTVGVGQRGRGRQRVGHAQPDSFGRGPAGGDSQEAWWRRVGGAPRSRIRPRSRRTPPRSPSSSRSAR